MNKIIGCDGFTSNQERRKAAIDCTDLMWDAFSKMSPSHEQVERFLLFKELHNEIMGELARREKFSAERASMLNFQIKLP